MPVAEAKLPASLSGHDLRGRADPPSAPDGFDETLYLLLNPDVAADLRAGVIESAKSHWLTSGREEERSGRRPSINEPRFYAALPPHQTRPPSAEELALLSPQDYLLRNPDVGGPQTDPAAALEHWTRYGRFEGRTRWPEPQVFARRAIDFTHMLRKPFGINFYAPFSARSGLGTAAKGYLAAMQAAGIPVYPCNLNYDMHPARITSRDYDMDPPYRINVIQANADSIGHVYNLFRLGHFDHAYTIAIWAWELSMLRPDWYPSFAACDEVWTLSDFNTAAVSAIAPVPVRTMNCVAAPAAPEPRFDRAYFQLPSGTIFLAAFDVGSSLDRKNPHAVVKAFVNAFEGRPGLYLVLKLHSGQENPTQLNDLLRLTRQHPQIIVRAGKLTDAEMRGLQACADCYVSAHRSEGFGLNIAECMLLGKPVIVTGYSGNMDFTTKDNSFLLSYGLTAIDKQSGPYLPGYLWAEPDQADLVKAMKRVADDPKEAQRRAAAGADTIRRKLSAEAVGTKIAARLDELGLREKIPGFIPLAGSSRGVAPVNPLAVAPHTSPQQIAAQPTISVIVPVYNVDPRWLGACIESVRAQTYPRWQLCLCNDGSTRADTVAMLRRYQGIDPRICIVHLAKNSGISAASNAAASIATGSYLLMLDNDDELTSDALHHVAAAIIADPSIDALYADEDKITPDGTYADHYYKPDWSPEHLESVMYTLHPVTVRTSVFLELGGFRAEYSGAQDYDLMLRVSRRSERIHHIPRLLYHWRMIPGSASAEVEAKPQALNAAQRALVDHVAAKYGPAAEVLPTKVTGYYRVRHRLVTAPEVTLVITTNNASIDLPERGKIRMVDHFVKSIKQVTDYPAFRILVVDNGNSSDDQIKFYQKEGVTLASYPGPVKPFNYAEKANFALRQVKTEHLVMLNDDMEAFEAEWLRSLVEFSRNSEVGGCGGKLLHADGTIQHAGVVLGVHGGPAHIYHNFPGDFVGYNGFTHTIRNYSVVTGACFATRLSVVSEVGGFNTAFAIDYNDIDLCLRMRQHGYRIVYTPFAQLYHFEGQTEKRHSRNPAETALFNAQWSKMLEQDPFYNVNLSRTRHDFSAR